MKRTLLRGNSWRQRLLREETAGYLKELRGLIVKPPLYKRAWFWGVMATVTAIVAAGVGTGIGVGTKDDRTMLWYGPR